jgi:hypothetical protein
MKPLNPEHVEWSRNHFRTIADGGAWAVPRSGLIFVKRGDTLALTARMPHDPAMPLTAEQLVEQQQSDIDAVTEHFGAAGVTVVDET